MEWQNDQVLDRLFLEPRAEEWTSTLMQDGEEVLLALFLVILTNWLLHHNFLFIFCLVHTYMFLKDRYHALFIFIPTIYIPIHRKDILYVG